MPQMSPLMWLNWMIMFSIILMLTNPINFFYKMENIWPMKKQTMISKNWKWYIYSHHLTHHHHSIFH